MAKRFLKTAVVSALFALTLAVSASAASAGGATTTTAVNFRTGAGTNYGLYNAMDVAAVWLDRALANN